MDENHQDKTESKLIATKNKSQLPPFSPEDEKEAQKELDRLRKRLRENENGAVNVNRKLHRKRTGFEDKTLWDWLNLLGVLAIPIVVVGATIAFGLLQIHLADLQHLSDQMLAQQQHDADQQSALDQQHTTTLQTYIDNIQDLVFNHSLLQSKQGDDVAVLARARTLTTLQGLGLDRERKGRLLIFLHEAHLIGFKDTNGRIHDRIIDLRDASLFDTVVPDSSDISGINLSSSVLLDAVLNKANLMGANLRDADLIHAILEEADLKYADLAGVNLYSADLRFADLRGADLRGAFLGDALLSFADLRGIINLTQQQLDQVHICTGAILPPGLTCHRNQ